jgi:hypothetical protein
MRQASEIREQRNQTGHRPACASWTGPHLLIGYSRWRSRKNNGKPLHRLTGSNADVVWAVIGFFFKLVFTLNGSAVLVGLVAAFFGLWSAAQTKQQQTRSQLWFASMWQAINDSSWRAIPELVIESILASGRQAAMWPARLFSSSLFPALALLAPMFLSISLWLNWKITPPILSHPVVVYCLLLVGCYGAVLGIIRRDSLTSSILILLGFISLGAYTAYFWVELLLRLPFAVVGILGVLLIPVIIFVLAFAFIACDFAFNLVISMAKPLFVDTKPWDWHISSEHGKQVAFGVAVSVALSASLTIEALLLGHLLDPTAWVPRTHQMLASNFVFDSMTIIITEVVLSRAVSERKRFSVPFAILLSASLAVAFAFSSLWCGLAFTKTALSVRELARVMVGLSVDGTRWEFGPYFFAMHSTFLPTAFCLVVVLLCWVAKSSLLPPITWFFGKTRHPDINGLALTARFLGLLAASLGFVGFALK